MALQFYNINRAVYAKPVSKDKDIVKRTSKHQTKSTRHENKLTKNNLAFLRSLRAI